VTLENGMKWSQWEHPTYPFKDETIEAHKWLRDQGYDVRGTTLVWGGWDRQNPPGLEDLNAQQLRNRIQKHIADIAGTFKGEIQQWDVVNEPRTSHDFQDKLGGNNAISSWFKFANSADPKAKLYVNEFGILNGPDSNTDALLKLVDDLRKSRAPIHGIGLQGHFDDHLPTPERMLEILDRLAKTGLDIQITEFDVATSDEQKQAKFTRDFYTTMFSHPSVNGITSWGFWEGSHWQPESAYFRRDWTYKPNGEALATLLTRTWKTEEQGTTGDDGSFDMRGFHGSYEVTVRHEGQRVAKVIELRKGQVQTETIVLPDPVTARAPKPAPPKPVPAPVVPKPPTATTIPAPITPAKPAPATTTTSPIPPPTASIPQAVTVPTTAAGPSATDPLAPAATAGRDLPIAQTVPVGAPNPPAKRSVTLRQVPKTTTGGSIGPLAPGGSTTVPGRSVQIPGLIEIAPGVRVRAGGNNGQANVHIRRPDGSISSKRNVGSGGALSTPAPDSIRSLAPPPVNRPLPVAPTIPGNASSRISSGIPTQVPRIIRSSTIPADIPRLERPATRSGSGIPADVPRAVLPSAATSVAPVRTIRTIPTLPPGGSSSVSSGSGIPANVPRTVLPSAATSVAPVRTIRTIPTLPPGGSSSVGSSGIPSNVPRTIIPSRTSSTTTTQRKPAETTIGPVRTIKPRPQGYVNPDLIPSATSPRRIDPTRSSLEELRNSLRNSSGGAIKTAP